MVSGQIQHGGKHGALAGKHRNQGGDMDKKDALSRRNFIKASGMAALGAAALGLAG